MSPRSILLLILVSTLTCWAFSCQEPPSPADNQLVNIKGIILGADGEPAADVPVSYVLLDAEFSNFLEFTVTASDGSFELLTPVGYYCSGLDINGYLQEWEFRQDLPEHNNAYAGKHELIDIGPDDTDIDLTNLPISLRDPAILQVTFNNLEPSQRPRLDLLSNTNLNECFWYSKSLGQSSTIHLAAGDQVRITIRGPQNLRDSILAELILEEGVNLIEL